MARSSRIAVALSWYGGLVAVVLSAAIWLTSYWRPMLNLPGSHYRCIYLGAGEAGFADHPTSLPSTLALSFDRWRGWSTYFWPQQGLHDSFVVSGRVRIETWRIPLWMPMAGTMAWATGMFFTRRRLRRPDWLCRTCGYDRRGLAAGALCPECGAAA